jgi:hypothetical protein
MTPLPVDAVPDPVLVPLAPPALVAELVPEVPPAPPIPAEPVEEEVSPPLVAAVPADDPVVTSLLPQPERALSRNAPKRR